MDVKIWEKESYEDCPDFLSFTAILDERGRITIPASVRKKLKLKSYSTIPITVKALKVKTEK